MQDQKVKKNAIHIVFQVINYSRSHESNLTDPEFRILTYLASHKGEKGIYPSKETLAISVKKHPRTVQTILHSLERKGIISIKDIPGYSNQYEIKLSTTLGEYASGATELTLGEYASGGEAVYVDTLGEYASLSDKTNNLNKITKRGTNRASRSALSIFSPDERNQWLAKDLRLNLNDEIESFKKRYEGKGKDLQYEFGRWLKGAKEYQDKKSTYGKGANGNGKQEIRCTVPLYGPGHPDWEFNRKWERERAERRNKIG